MPDSKPMQNAAIDLLHGLSPKTTLKVLPFSISPLLVKEYEIQAMEAYRIDHVAFKPAIAFLETTQLGHV